jgi:hypothetical protein
VIRRSDVTVSDSNGTPEGGVYITVKDDTGALATLYNDAGGLMANPFQSTAVTGVFTYNIADGDAGTFTEEFRLTLGGTPKTIEAVDLSVSSSAVRNVATRTALALLSTALPAYLTETGREGTFVFDSADHSAHVTADTAQGIYVAPASAPTGASGAWIRQFTGPLVIDWFGAVPDCTAVGTGTNNAPAINAAMAVAALDNKSAEVLVPGNILGYRMASPLVYTIGVKLRGQGFHENPGQVGVTTYPAPQNWRGSILVFDQNIAGLQFIGFTDNLANATAFEYEGSSFSIVEDIALYGGGGTTVTAHGIETRVSINLRNVRIENFAGNGVKVIAYTAGAFSWGNASNAQFNRVISRGNKCHGFYIEGIDSNVISLINCDSALNGGVGFLDKSLLGNTYLACHAATNNQSYGTATAARTQVTADWAGLSDQYAGSYVIAGGTSTPSLYLGCYTETGVGTKSELLASAIVIGGILSETGARTASYTAPTWQGGVTGLSLAAISAVTGGLSISHKAGSAIDLINSAGGTALVRVMPGTGTYSNQQLMGNGNSVALGEDTLAGGGAVYRSSDSFTFRNAAQSVVFTVFDATGINITATTPQLKISGTKVVGVRDTGWTADTGTAKKTATATYAVGTTLTYSAAYVQAEQTATSTRLQLIEPALRDATQEIKAIKDALMTHGLLGA